MPNALFNFLSLLGFAPNTNKTILSPEEIISLFDVQKLVKAPAIFDEQKLFFINNQYLKKIPLKELVEITQMFLQRENIFLEKEYLTKIVILLRDRSNYIQQIVSLYLDFFVKNEEIDNEIISFVKENEMFSAIKVLKKLFLKLEDFQSSFIDQIIKQFSEITNLKAKNFF